MATTFVKIATVTASGSTTTMDFSSIPSTYTDLVLKVSARSAATDTNVAITIKFNGSTSGYSGRQLYGFGSGTGSSTSGVSTSIDQFWMEGASWTASTFSNGEIYIPNYSGSSNKSASMDSVTENNATANYMSLAAGLWSNTAAINQITLTSSNGNFAQYSTATLYGISKS